MLAETHQATVHGWPAALIILVILAIFIIGIVAVVKWLARKARGSSSS